MLFKLHTEPFRGSDMPTESLSPSTHVNHWHVCLKVLTSGFNSLCPRPSCQSSSWTRFCQSVWDQQKLLFISLFLKKNRFVSGFKINLLIFTCMKRICVCVCVWRGFVCLVCLNQQSLTVYSALCQRKSHGSVEFNLRTRFSPVPETTGQLTARKRCYSEAPCVFDIFEAVVSSAAVSAQILQTTLWSLKVRIWRQHHSWL